MKTEMWTWMRVQFFRFWTALVVLGAYGNSAGIAGVSGQKTGNVDYVSWAHVFDVTRWGPLRVV